MKRCLRIAVAFWMFNQFYYMLWRAHPEWFGPMSAKDFYVCVEIKDGRPVQSDACTEPVPELPAEVQQ